MTPAVALYLNRRLWRPGKNGGYAAFASPLSSIPESLRNRYMNQDSRVGILLSPRFFRVSVIDAYAKSIDEADIKLASEIWSTSEVASFIHPRGHEGAMVG